MKFKSPSSARTAAMTWAILPDCSARAEWLLAVLMDRAFSHWVRYLPLDGGDGDDGADTGRAIPDDDDDDAIAFLASQPSTSLQPSSLKLCPLADVEQLTCSLTFPGDHGVCSAVIVVLLTLEWAIYRRCVPGQPPLSVSQLANRRKCARLVTDFVAVLALPPHASGFPRHLLDLTHTWSDRSDNGINLSDILACAAAVCLFVVKTQQPRFPRALPGLLTAVAASRRASLTTLQCCIQQGLYSKSPAPSSTDHSTQKVRVRECVCVHTLHTC